MQRRDATTEEMMMSGLALVLDVMREGRETASIKEGLEQGLTGQTSLNLMQMFSISLKVSRILSSWTLV